MTAPTLTFSPAMFHAAHVAKIKTVTRRHIPGLDAKAIDKSAMSAALQRIVAILHSGMVVDFGPPAHLPGKIKPMVTSWAVSHIYDTTKPSDLRSANGKPLQIWFNDGTKKPTWAGKIRPGRFLPKSLYSLAPQVRILSARPEPLLDITEADALLEGITPDFGDPEKLFYAVAQADGTRLYPSLTARASYFALWNSLHPDHTAYTNPIVWRYEFAPCS
jgi:hypothetical protein